MTTQVLERSAVEERREKLHADLSMTRQRIRDTRNKAAMEDGHDEDLAELLATQQRLESKLEGLDVASKQVDAQEEAVREAKQAKALRQGLFEAIVLMHKRLDAFAWLDAGIRTANESLATASEASSAYTSTVTKHAGDLKGVYGLLFEGRLWDMLADFQAKFPQGKLPTGFADHYRSRAESELAQLRAKFPEIVDDQFIADAVKAAEKKS